MKCTFVEGQRVVCDKPPGERGSWVYVLTGEKTFHGPRPGEICQIDGFDVEGWWIGLHFKGHLGYYDYTAFRPLNERPTETSIEALKKLCDPANHKVLEDA